MAKDFANTQTGGSGTTAQTGESVAKEVDVKNVDVRQAKASPVPPVQEAQEVKESPSAPQVSARSEAPIPEVPQQQVVEEEEIPLIAQSNLKDFIGDDDFSFFTGDEQEGLEEPDFSFFTGDEQEGTGFDAEQEPPQAKIPKPRDKGPKVRTGIAGAALPEKPRARGTITEDKKSSLERAQEIQREVLGVRRTNPIKLSKDSRGRVNIFTGNEAEFLMEEPAPPTDLIGRSIYESEQLKGGFVELPTTEDIDYANTKLNTLKEDRDKQLERVALESGEDSKQYRADKAMFDALINSAEDEVVYQKQQHEEAIDDARLRAIELRHSNPHERADNIDVINKTTGTIDLATGRTPMNLTIKNVVQLGLENEEKAREELANFASRNIREDLSNWSYSESQLKDIEEMQKIASEISSKPKGSFTTEAAQMSEQIKNYFDGIKEHNTLISRAENSGRTVGDVLMQDAKLWYANGGGKEVLGEISTFGSAFKDLGGEEVLFQATAELYDYVSGLKKEGKLILDSEGNLDYSPRISERERTYIEGVLNERSEFIDSNRSKMHNDNRQVIDKNNRKINSLEASIRSLEKGVGPKDARLSRGSFSGETDPVAAQIEAHVAEIERLNNINVQLKRNNGAILLSEPKEVVLDVSQDMSDAAINSWSSIPQELSAYERFKIFYHGLIKKNENIEKNNDISILKDLLKDFVDAETLGISLNSAQKEYYQNAAILYKLAPLYAVNASGIDKEAEGFFEKVALGFDSFKAGMHQMLFPTISQATDIGTTHTDRASQIVETTANILGFEEGDFDTGETLNQLIERKDIDFYSVESFSKMGGTSIGVMGQIGFGGGVFGVVAKTFKWADRLLKANKALGTVTTITDDIRRLANVYARSMKNSRYGKYMYSAAQMGWTFEKGGMTTSGDEELNFASGFFGGLAGAGFNRAFKDVTPSQALKIVDWIFGTNSKKAQYVFKRLGDNVAYTKNLVKAGAFREFPEEATQELVQIYNDELRTRGFWEEVSERYGSFSSVGELFISSTFLGMSMGVFTNEYMVDLKERMPLEERRRVEQLAKEIMADNAKAQAETEVKANEIASIKESINKTEEDAVQERKTEEVDVAEEARTGEGVVEEDQEAKAPEEAPTEERKLELDPDLANIDPDILAAREGDLEAQKRLEEYGIDWEKTTTYRFTGQSEVDALLADETIESKRGKADRGIDVTSSPEVTTGSDAEYRVTFKESFDKNNGLGKVMPKNEKDSNLEKGRGYSLDDVAKIEKIDENGNVVEVVHDAATITEAPTEERINATNLEEAQKLHEQGYRPEIEGRVDEEATVDELANYFFTRPSIDMVKKGVAKEAPAGTRLFSEPNPETVDIARKYKEEKGIDTPEGEPFRELDTEKSKRISDAYEAMEHNPNDPEVKEAYQAMADETMEQHKSITDAGYTFEIWEGKGEPYANSQEMIDDVRNNKHMYILSTEKDFGDTPITEQQRTENPLLKDSGVKDVNGKPLLINDVFRGVHDFFGHTERGNSFGAKGEENAWDVHARMYSDKARRAMTTETRGQNSYVNFSGVNDAANAKFKQAAQLAKEGKTEEANRLREEARSEMSFAEQKIGLLPEEFSQIEEKYTKKQGAEKTTTWKSIRNTELTSKDLNALRTAIRNKDKNSPTLEVLDEVAKAMRGEDFSLPYELDYMADGMTFNDVASLLIEDGVFETHADVRKFIDERVISSKTLGEKIRKGKIDDDIAMSGIPGFKQAWNAVVEVTAATVDTIDGIIQKVKESDWYKGLKESDRRKADKVLDKEREKIVKGAIEESTGVEKTKADKKAYAALKSQVNNAKTKEEIADAQQTLIDYAREVLPKFKKYTQTEVTAMMNRVKRATSSTGLKNALDAIDKKAFNFKEETRKKSVERIKKRFKDPQEKKKTGTLKTSKIGVDASRKIEALRQEVADKIDNMTQNQLDKLESKLENIIAKGKEAVIAREAARQEKKRKDRLVPLRELVKLNEKSTKRKGAIDESKISEKEGESIIEFLRDRDGFVVYDEQVFTGKTDFERYLKSKNETIDSIGPVEAFETTATREEAKKIYQERRRNRIKDAARTVTKDSLSPTLQNKLDRLSSGSAALYRWIEKNIKKPLADAEYDTEVGRHEKQKRLGNIMKDIFGKNILNWQTMTRLPNSWTKKAPIEIGRNKKKVTNGKILTYYMSARTQAKPIYKVGEKYYDSPAETKKAADNAGIPYSSVEDFMYTNKYNPEVIKEMSTSLSDKLENGLKKMEEINEYVEVKNPKLKQVEEKFQEFLQDMKNSDEFGGIYETLFDSEFSEGYYFPIRRSIISEIQASDVLKESNNNHGSAMADSLRQRVNNPKAPLNLDVDAYTIMLNYANTMEHAKNFLPVTDNVRNLVNEKSVPEIIKKIGSNGFFELNTQLLRVLTDGETRPRQNKALGGLSKWTVVTTLMAKTGSIPKQLTSQFHYYGAGIIIGVPVYKVVWQAMKILPNAPVRGASALYNWAGGNSIPSPSLTSEELDVVKGFLTSPYIIDRLKGTNIDVETRSIINGLQGATHKNIARVITQILMSPTIVGDVGGIVMGGVPLALAVYNTKKKIMPHKEALDYAIRFAIEVTKDTQQSQSDRVLSNAQVDPWYRAMLQYRTSQTAVAANTIKGIHMLKNWKGYAPENIDPNSSDMKNWMDKTRPLRAGVFKSIYFPIFGNAVFNAIAGGTFTMIYLALKGTDDEERRKELMRTALYNLVADDVSSDLQGYGLPGWLIDAQLNSLRNRGYFNNIPVIKAMIGSGKEPGIISGLEIPYVQSYKGAWDLYQEGEINFHDIFDAYEDVDEKARIDVFKNFSNGVESWTQWAESEGEDKMTWWDAFMNRRLDEEGRMFKTARERDDWLFQQIFPKEDERFPQFSPDFQKKLEKSIDGSSTFNKLDDFEKWINEPDISTIEKTIRPSEPSESGYGGLKYEAAKEKQKKRYKSKISKERAANVQQEEINRLYAPSGMKEALKGMRIADPEKSVKTKPEPESADVFLENIRKEYIRVVGKEPSKDATLSGMLKEIESKKQ